MTDLGKEAPEGREAEVWQVGDLTIDVGRQQVTRGETEIPLPKLSFDLLLVLVRRAPDVVSSDDLMSAVWPRLVVGPETVVQRVKLLRQALDDRSDEPRYVAALRGRGYRLVTDARRVVRATAPLAPDASIALETPAAGPLTEPAADSVAGPIVTTVPPAQSRPAPPNEGRVSRKLAAAAAVAAIVLIAGWFALRDTGPEHRQAATTAATDVATDADRTVAVLPFSNLSPDERDAYLALSLPEMALNRLTALPGLRVIARESSFLAGRETSDPREIGRKLDAAYLVSGSVQRNGDALRVTVRLVDARDATQLWSRDLEGRVADVFRIQDEIAEQVSATLQSRVASVGVAGPLQPRSQNVEAYLAYLRGRAAIRRFTVAEAESAAREFERAIELDPAFAAAQAALYDARMQAAGLRHDDLDAARKRFRPLLERALALDPQSGTAWFARAMWEDLDLEDRDAAFRRAMALDPGNTRGLVAFSEYLDITDKASDGGRVPGSGFDPSSWRARAHAGSVQLEGRAAEAQRVLEQALRIDPLSPRARFRKAMREFRQSFVNAEPPILAILENDPEFYPALQRIASYRAMFHGHPAEAVALIERAIGNDPQNPWGPHSAAAFYLDAGDPDAARAVAATTPVSAQTAQILLAQFVGDWRTAGEVAMTRWGFEWGFAESRGSFQALRDYALRRRDYGRPVQLLRERYNLPASGAVAISLGNFRPAVHLAHLELAQGNKARAEETLHAVIRWIDADNKAPPAFKKHTRAQAMMLLGDREQAFVDLAASYHDDNDYNQWWYILERDPVFEPLHDDPRYKALLAEVRAWAAREREAVESLRREGKVPRRSVPARKPS